MPFLDQIAQGAAGGILGIGFGAIQNQQQYHQQERLQELQIRGQQQMTDYNYGKELQMWHDTNYPAQVAELEKAGLNPALLYAKSGAGGATTGTPSANVTGGTAQKGNNDLAAEGMGLQMGLIKAQTENVQADTQNKLAQTPKTQAETTNIKAQQLLTEAQTRLTEVQTAFQYRSFDSRLENIDRTVEKLTQEAKGLNQQNQITKETMDSTIKQIKTKAIGAVLENYLTQAKTQQSEADKKYIEMVTKWIPQDYANKAQEIMQGWDKISQGNQQLSNEQLKLWGVNEDFPPQLIDAIKGIIQAGIIKGGLNTTLPKPIWKK